jgi:hypothetical protein
VSRLRIVLAGGFLACYPEGGGHWTVFLQYLLGLRALGHDAWWLELLDASGDPARDARRIATFFTRLGEFGLAERGIVLLVPKGLGTPTLETVEPHGRGRLAVADLIASADLVWNFACALRPPLLSAFRHRVLVDLDPGHLQVSALTVDLGVHEHDAFLTVGAGLDDPAGPVPALGLHWRSFLPFVHLPLWPPVADPGRAAPFTSVTQWTWEEVWLHDRPLSVSKRTAYLRYLDVPARTGRSFELAANIHPDDRTGDRERLAAHGWRLVDPHRVAGTPAAYRDYIARSRAELGCAKPIHRELRTGWFSDRSACYLASGRPVLFEDTGVGARLPAGAGLCLFHDAEGAAAAVADIDGEWTRHSHAARALAQDFLDARRRLPAMLEASAVAGV